MFYSGDTNSTTDIERLFINTGAPLVDKIYTEVTIHDYIGNPHLYIGRLEQVVPQEIRHLVHCMHLDSDECIQRALSSGFNVVETIQY